MVKAKIKVDFSKILHNVKGEPIKDMIDVPDGTTRETAADLSFGSLIANALMLSKDTDKKTLLKHFQLSQELEQCLKNDDGVVEWDVDQINKLNEAWAKMDNPNFNIPLYAGAVQDFIEEHKAIAVLKDKEIKDKKPNPTP